MNNKKTILIIVFLITFSLYLFADHNQYFDKNEIQNFTFNSKSIWLIKIKSFLTFSDFNPGNSMDSFINFKNSLENIINKKSSVPQIEPDFIIIFTFINSLYYLIKFKINLWSYNQTIFFEKNNKIKPYFNINLKNKIINVGFNVIL